MRAAEIYPRQGRFPYILADAPDDADVDVVEYGPTDRFGATVEMVDGLHREYWTVQDDGAIALLVSIDEDDNALSQFKPPLVIAPPLLEPGVPFASSAAMRVVDLRNPKREKERGTATLTIEYVGDETIRLPRGDVTARRVEVMFRADLRLADVEHGRILYLLPDAVIVASENTEKIVVLGVLPERKEEVWVLVEP